MWSEFARRLWRDERGATAIEYGLIVALIVVAMMTTLGSIGDTVSNMWNLVASNYMAVA
ncbi:Flp family type IVb pilin [Chakrabartia godavariana]|nr:Flp family type IVb pilin [Chakrabartia godavariana]